MGMDCGFGTGSCGGPEAVLLDADQDWVGHIGMLFPTSPPSVPWSLPQPTFHFYPVLARRIVSIFTDREPRQDLSRLPSLISPFGI